MRQPEMMKLQPVGGDNVDEGLPNDWEGAEQRLADFLVYRCGGSDKYIKERGHPRLRMRHIQFTIGEKERDRWISLMSEAILERKIENPAADLLSGFFIQTADFMRNVEG